MGSPQMDSLRWTAPDLRGQDAFERGSSSVSAFLPTKARRYPKTSATFIMVADVKSGDGCWCWKKEVTKQRFERMSDSLFRPMKVSRKDDVGISRTVSTHSSAGQSAALGRLLSKPAATDAIHCENDDRLSFSRKRGIALSLCVVALSRRSGVHA